MNTAMVLLQSGLQHAEAIPHCSQPLVPAHPSPPHLQTQILCCLSSLSIVLTIFLVAWQRSDSFIQAKFSTASRHPRQEPALQERHPRLGRTLPIFEPFIGLHLVLFLDTAIANVQKSGRQKEPVSKSSQTPPQERTRSRGRKKPSLFSRESRNQKKM